MTPTQTEIRALVPLLEADWETPEELAKALIKQLDETRGSRTLYYVVMQFGIGDGKVWYHGLGPFPGATTARNAVKGWPGATLASKIAVIPVTNVVGMERRLKEVG